MPIKRWISTHWHRLASIEATPTAIALGFSIGIFLGFTPLFGLKTLLALGFAFLFRASKLAAVVGVTLHDVILPFMPMVLRLEYQLGFWCLSHPHHFAPKLHLMHMNHRVNLQAALSWTTFFTTTTPLLIGSVIIGLPLAAISFVVLRAILQRRAARKHPELERPLIS